LAHADLYEHSRLVAAKSISSPARNVSILASQTNSINLLNNVVLVPTWNYSHDINNLAGHNGAINYKGVYVEMKLQLYRDGHQVVSPFSTIKKS